MNAPDENLLDQMCNTLEHRGPDGKSVFSGGPAAMGVCRLRAMSRYMGLEPVHNEGSSVWILLDGEIFNHNELRDDLERRGHKFYTTSGEEVIPHVYEEFGFSFPSRLNGVFALALFDQEKERLLLARDRIGVKPLYYTIDTNMNELTFASEMKAVLQNRDIKRKVNVYALHDYLAYGFVPPPETIIERVHKLLPGHYLLCDRERWSIEQYWDLSFQSPDPRVDYRKSLYDRLKQSVRSRLPEDGDVGVFLSGGIDSSTVLALTSQLIEGDRIKAFSVGCEEASFDELEDARVVAEHFEVEHHEAVITAEMADLAEKLIYYADEPLADWSIFPTYLVSRLAKEHVDIVLSGDAADDLFAGHERLVADIADRYYHYVPDVLRNSANFIIGRLPDSSQQRGLNVIKRFVEGSSMPPELRDFRWWTYMRPGEESRIFESEVALKIGNRDPFDLVKRSLQNNNAPDLLGRELYVSLKHLSQGIRTKVEQMSMGNSLAVRIPFLDDDVVDFSARIPSKLKIRFGTTKWILKKAMSNILPRSTLRKGKMGFSIPMKIWLRNDLRGKIEQLMSETSIQRTGYFRFEYVDKLVSEHLTGRKDNAHRLWPLIAFMIWHSIYIDENLSGIHL